MKFPPQEKPSQSMSTNEGSPVYTHGMERIYAVETIDLSTVRPMSPSTTLEQPNVNVSDRTSTNVELPPLTLDLGDAYRGWMPPVVDDEPLEVLQLSTQALRAAKTAGASCLGHLIAWRDAASSPPARVGQGHYDECMVKLESHLADGHRRDWTRVDFAALLHTLLAHIESKSAHLLARPYGLDVLFPLTAAQEMEIRRVGQDGVTAMEEEARRKILEEKLCERAWSRMRQVVDVFAKPWARQRGGLVTREQLYERVTGVGTDPREAEAVLQFCFDHLFAQDPVTSYFFELDRDLFCPDEFYAVWFERISSLADSYLYAAHVTYPLSELIARMQGECAQRWEGYPAAFFTNAIRYNRGFLVRRRSDGVPVVMRNPLLPARSSAIRA